MTIYFTVSLKGINYYNLPIVIAILALLHTLAAYLTCAKHKGLHFAYVLLLNVFIVAMLGKASHLLAMRCLYAM